MGSVRLTKGYECDVPMAQHKGLIGNKHTNLPRSKVQSDMGGGSNAVRAVI